ncbi:HEAT repeat domain-containing protein [Planktothricoides raciborskii]|uniref:HEAT repeat domain-containing protein n=1 Tax=Planktothricoides raciborskii GIHE-MW2 TaxID=2792601 RepID=A0AAU8J608_9CYAN
MTWDNFLREIADEFGLSPEETKIFRIRWSEENKEKPDKEVQNKIPKETENYKKFKTAIFNKFEFSKQNLKGCKTLEDSGPQKGKRLLEWLEEKYQEWLQAQPATPAEKPINWREICERNLAQQKELTTNPFTNAYGIAPKLEKVYVPLAIVERKPPKPKLKNQPEETEKKTLIPIEEKRFFEEVLRQGKSEISQGRKIAIIGEPGSGKTTRLQKIADWILDQNLGLPIWVSLADLTQATVYKYIEDLWLAGENLTIDALKQEKNRIWLLLDGLDEMTSKIESRHVSALLGGWLQDARVVVTCRVNVWEADKNAFSGFDVFKNLEFSREQVNQYIGNWFKEIGDATTGESLEKELAKSENLAFNRLIQNPLRLWMLCQIWQTGGGGLPDTQAELYCQFVDWVYRWKADEKILNQRSEIDQALARLALAAIEQKYEVSRFQLSESWIVTIMGSRQIFQCFKNLGWLNPIERLPEPIYAFLHLTFQEYFAALAVDDWDDFLPRNHVNCPVPGKEYRIFEPQWKQVILFWLGRSDVTDQEKFKKFNKKKEEFIEKLVNFDDGCDGGFYEDRAYFMAAAGISEFKTCSLADAIVKQIVQWGFGYYHQEKQQWRTFLDPIKFGAREILPQTDRKRTIQELCQILEHPQCNEDTCREAADSLGEIDPGNKKAIAALVKVIKDTDNDDTRWWAAYCLGNIDPGNKKAIAALVRILETTDNESTRWQVVDSLGKIGQGNKTAIAALVKFLDLTEDEDTLIEAAESLGQIDPGNETAIAALVKVIETTEDENTRWQAVDCLGEIGQGNKTAITALVKVIETTDNESTRWQVVDSLGKIGQGNKTAITALVKVIETTEDEDTHIAAAEYLWKIGQGNKTAIAVLVKVIEDTDNEDTHRQAIYCLGKIGQGDETAIAALVEVLKKTEDEHTRRKAVNCLGEIGQGNETAITALVRLLEITKNKDTRWLAARSLGEIDPGNQTAIAALVKVLEAPEDEDTHIAAAYCLGKIITTNENRKYVVTALQPYFNDETYENDFNLFTTCYKVLWNIAQDLPYPDFCMAWHNDRNLIAEQLEAQQDICSQLQPVSNKIFCCLEQLEILVKETDIAEIAQELANQIFEQIAHNEPIPTIKGKSDLKRELANLTISLQVEKIALIFDLRGLEINPNFKQSALYEIALSLAKSRKISIAWISDRIANHPLNIDPPMRGFISEQDNLLDVLQNWLNDV